MEKNEKYSHWFQYRQLDLDRSQLLFQCFVFLKKKQAKRQNCFPQYVELQSVATSVRWHEDSPARVR